MSAPVGESEQAADGLVRTRYRVTSGSCLDCAGDVSGALGKVLGVAGVDVLATVGLVVVTGDERATPGDIQTRAAQLGLSLEPVGAQLRAEPGRTPWWQRPNLIALLASFALLVSGLVVSGLLGQPAAALGLYAASVGIGGAYPLRAAVAVVRSGRLTIGVLLVVAAAGALALGRLDEAAEVVVVFSLGEVLEDYASDRARGSIRALMALVPSVAQVRQPDGTTRQTPVEELAPGDALVVRPGERLPTDGQVVEGASAVDQSPVTGESIPVAVEPGSTVFGGSVNGTGALLLEVTKPYADTTLARVIHQVEEAQGHRGRAQRFADRFGAIYTPTMFAIAVAVGLFGALLGLGIQTAIYRALVVLTVSCSCALVISVPVAVVAAVSRAARDGILIKGGAHLETLARVRTLAIDKTGTLTIGQPRLTDVIPVDTWSSTDVLVLAGSVEAASEHPLARAILAAVEERGLVVKAARNAHALPGLGVEAAIDGQQVFVGRAPVSIGQHERLAADSAALEAAGKTVAVVLADGRTVGLIAVADELRAGAAATVEDLHGLGVSPVVMLTGDNEATARAIATEAGIDQWRSALLPEDKTAAILELRGRHGILAMVGDGVNDAPALATADIGVAMGAAATDVALETADVALMADDLTKLPAALRLSRRALANIHQNVVLSLVAMALLVAAALAGQLSLTSGILLNEGSALAIIANGLRLLRRHVEQPPTARLDIPVPAAR